MKHSTYVCVNPFYICQSVVFAFEDSPTVDNIFNHASNRVDILQL